MAKSSAAQALASLSHKFQAKIKEVGKLKVRVTQQAQRISDLKEQLYTAAYTSPTIQLAPTPSSLSAAHQAQATTIRLLRQDVADTTVHLNNVSKKAQNNANLLRDAQAAVSSWKSFSGIMFVLGMAVGTLSALAYAQQMGL